MKQLKFMSLWIMAFFCLSAYGESITVGGKCVEGNGTLKTEQRNLSSFHRIDINGAYDLNITCQKKQQVEITGDANILPHIISKVQNNTLVISSDKPICPTMQLKINISIDHIDRISASGSNDIDISDIHNQHFMLDISGSGDVQASGSTQVFHAVLSGAGDLKAKNLHAQNVQVKIAGAGDAVVYASKKLAVDISGAGSLSYYGNPAEISKEISGWGEIIRK